MRGCEFDRLSHGMCSRHEARHMPRLRLAPLCSHALSQVAVAELGFVRPLMNATLTRMTRSPGFTVFLLVVALICLAIHFEIYRRTSASAFINQPELYFRNVFIIRDSNRQAIGEVSYATGFSSYITAFVAVAGLGWGVARIILRRRR